MPLTIQEAIRLGGKTAQWLASVDLLDDWYHQNISKAAQALVADGKGDYTYSTQYASGNSHWNVPNDTIVLVSLDHEPIKIW